MTVTTPRTVLAHDSEAKLVLSVEETAQLLGISRWLLLQEVKRGSVPHKRVGRRIVFSRERLLQWLAEDSR